MYDGQTRAKMQQHPILGVSISGSKSGCGGKSGFGPARLFFPSCNLKTSIPFKIASKYSGLALRSGWSSTHKSVIPDPEIIHVESHRSLIGGEILEESDGSGGDREEGVGGLMVGVVGGVEVEANVLPTSAEGEGVGERRREDTGRKKLIGAEIGVDLTEDLWKVRSIDNKRKDFA
ncbi:hypothetical protein M5K25_003139 [Dendrobium thyrsiflorum]|uniref:Uncharacterized protein n=1 Tax=Dendrobium thyrsiflorum TaxID=117978 RepID=A0ABD0VX74_DENTH